MGRGCRVEDRRVMGMKNGRGVRRGAALGKNKGLGGMGKMKEAVVSFPLGRGIPYEKKTGKGTILWEKKETCSSCPLASQVMVD